MIHRFWIDSEIFRMHRDSSGIDSEPRFLQQIALWSSFYLHTQMLMKKSAKERLCDRWVCNFTSAQNAFMTGD